MAMKKILTVILLAVCTLSEIYLHLSEGNATGLFERGFFESDIQRAFKLLKEIIEK